MGRQEAITNLGDLGDLGRRRKLAPAALPRKPDLPARSVPLGTCMAFNQGFVELSAPYSTSSAIKPAATIWPNRGGGLTPAG